MERPTGVLPKEERPTGVPSDFLEYLLNLFAKKEEDNVEKEMFIYSIAEDFAKQDIRGKIRRFEMIGSTSPECQALMKPIVERSILCEITANSDKHMADLWPHMRKLFQKKEIEDFITKRLLFHKNHTLSNLLQRDIRGMENCLNFIRTISEP